MPSSGRDVKTWGVNNSGEKSLTLFRKIPKQSRTLFRRKKNTKMPKNPIKSQKIPKKNTKSQKIPYALRRSNSPLVETLQDDLFPYFHSSSRQTKIRRVKREIDEDLWRVWYRWWWNIRHWLHEYKTSYQPRRQVAYNLLCYLRCILQRQRSQRCVQRRRLFFWYLCYIWI